MDILFTLLLTLLDWVTDLPVVFWTAVSASAAVLGLVVLGVALLVALSQTRVAVQSRHAALMADLSRRWDEEPIGEARRLVDLLGPRFPAVIAQWDAAKDPRSYMVERVPNFFEDLSVLEQVGAIDFEMIRMSLGRTVLEIWEIWEPHIVAQRRRWDDPEIYLHFELLMKKMKGSFVEEPLPKTDETS